MQQMQPGSGDYVSYAMVLVKARRFLEIFLYHIILYI